MDIVALQSTHSAGPDAYPGSDPLVMPFIVAREPQRPGILHLKIERVVRIDYLTPALFLILFAVCSTIVRRLANGKIQTTILALIFRILSMRRELCT
jgi:hypothetical protein